MQSKIKFISVTLTLLFLTSCRSGGVQNGALTAPEEKNNLRNLTQITSQAVNYRAHYSKLQNKILFISHTRPKHPHAQIYEYDLDTKAERRITYQDGEVYDAIYSANGHSIYYSSSTDEIKENPNLQILLNSSRPGTTPPTLPCVYCDSLSQPLPMTEIYESHIDGSFVRRLTESAQFDGLISLKPGTQEILFTSLRNKTRQLFVYNADTRKTHLFSGKLINLDSSQYSYDGKQLLGVNQPPPHNASTEIWLSPSATLQMKTLISDNSLNIDPAWHPDQTEFVFASNRNGLKTGNAKNFDLYVARIDGTCLRGLTSHSATERWPQFSPDGKKLLFTSDRSGSLQIYEAEYISPPCPQS